MDVSALCPPFRPEVDPGGGETLPGIEFDFRATEMASNDDRWTAEDKRRDLPEETHAASRRHWAT